MKRLKDILFIALAVLSFSSCNWFADDKEKKLDKVMILYAPGFNSLSSDLVGDIDELKRGDLPSRKDKEAVVIVNHRTQSYLNYGKPVKPVIMRLYHDKKKGAVLDTLAFLAETDLLTKPDVITTSLNYIAEKFKSESYGLILSSHGSGWLPAGYYGSPEKYDGSSHSGSGDEYFSRKRPAQFESAVPYVENDLPGPKVRTFGEELYYENNVKMSYESTVQEIARAIPYHMDYILFDACLMGGIEVAYELKDKCSYIGFSQAEELADGLNYSQITTHLLKSGEPDLQAVVDDYYDTYMARTGDYKSATYSLVKCSELESLATTCKGLFEAYRTEIASVKPSTVQRYYRSYHHWFYDLEDILVKSGVPDTDLSALRAALDRCVVHKVCTEAFMPYSSGFQIETFSGLSMYLPCHGSAYLDAFYKTLSWNSATALVK